MQNPKERAQLNKKSIVFWFTNERECVLFVWGIISFSDFYYSIAKTRRDMERLFGVDAASLSWICLDCGNTCLEGNAKFVWMEHLAFIEGTITRLNAYLFAKKDIACFLCWSNKYRNLKLVRTETPSICLFTKIGRWKRKRRERE